MKRGKWELVAHHPGDTDQDFSISFHRRLIYAERKERAVNKRTQRRNLPYIARIWDREEHGWLEDKP